MARVVGPAAQRATWNRWKSDDRQKVTNKYWELRGGDRNCQLESEWLWRCIVNVGYAIFLKHSSFLKSRNTKGNQDFTWKWVQGIIFTSVIGSAGFGWSGLWVLLPLPIISPVIPLLLPLTLFVTLWGGGGDCPLPILLPLGGEGGDWHLFVGGDDGAPWWHLDGLPEAVVVVVITVPNPEIKIN